MTTTWIQKITGSLEQKKHYRQYRARAANLPPDHRAAVKALERYLTYYGALVRGDTLVAMLADLADLFEQGAADGTTVRQIVGEDPVEFAETFLQNYSEGQWINTERQRLTAAIDHLTHPDNDNDSPDRGRHPSDTGD